MNTVVNFQLGFAGPATQIHPSYAFFSNHEVESKSVTNVKQGRWSSKRYERPANATVEV